MKVQGLSFSSYAVRDYVELDLYFSVNHDKTAVIHCEIHIVKDLKVNILIKTDILISEKINVLLSQWKVIIESCQNVQLNLNVITLLNQINQLLLLNDKITISVYDSIIVQIKPLNDLSTNRDLLFELKCKLADVYAYTSIVNYTLTSIEVCNDFSKAVIISHYTSLNWIVKYEADSCFLISSDLLLYAELFNPIDWVKTTFWTLLAVSVIYHVISDITVKSEHQLLNNITVYE